MSIPVRKIIVKDFNNIELKKLCDIEDLNTWAYNICLNNNLLDLKSILKYYWENKNFLKLKRIGEFINYKLIDVCKKYEIIALEKYNEDEIDLNNEKGYILDLFNEKLINDLSTRPRNALSRFLKRDYSIKNTYKLLFAKNSIKLKVIYGVGVKSVKELENYKSTLSKKIEFIKLADDKKVIKIEYMKVKLIDKFKSISIVDLNNLINKNGEIYLLSLIENLLFKNRIYSGDDLAVFLNTLNYFENRKYYRTQNVSKILNSSNSRIRQIRSRIYNGFNNRFKFIFDYYPDFESQYNIPSNTDLIYLDNKSIKKIIENEKTVFNKNFIYKIISVKYSQTHAIVGKERNIIYNKNKGLYKYWKNIYIISKELVSVFEFEKFLNEIIFRLNSRITESYTLDFDSHFCEILLKDKSKYKRVYDVCNKILKADFDIVIDKNKKIRFKKNLPPVTDKLAIEILNEVKKPLTAKQIKNRLSKKYVERNFDLRNLVKSIRKNQKIIYFGRVGVYGLKSWETSNPLLKGGTIKHLIMEYIENYGAPAHIIDIEKYISQFLKTNFDNIYAIVIYDKTKSLLKMNQYFIGLQSKKNSEQYKQYYRLPARFNHRLFKFIGSRKSVSYNLVINYYSKKFDVEEKIIEKIIEFQISRGRLVKIKNELCYKSNNNS